MDTTEFSEGAFISPDVVKNSPTKYLVITGEGTAEDTDWGKKLSLPVQIDQRSKTWRPTIDSVKNLQQVLGKDSKLWLGKPIRLMVITAKGKEVVLGVPEMIPPQPVVVEQKLG